MGLSFTIDAGPRQRSHSQVRSRGTHDHILLSQIRVPPQPGGRGPRIYIPQEQGSPVIPPALGSLFVASYDSQGYGGGIVFKITLRHGPRRKYRFSIIVERVYRAVA
jgi:hypothetical protein